MPFKRLFLGMIILVLASCSPSGDSSQKILKKYQIGELELVVKSSPLELNSSELFYVTLTAEAPEGRDFSFLEEDFSFGQFLLFESHTSKLKLNSRERVTQTMSLALEPDLPGTYKCPPLQIQSGEDKILTDEMTIIVKSVIPQGDEKLRPQATFSSTEYSFWLWPVIIIVIVLLIVFIKLLQTEDIEEKSLHQEFAEKLQASNDLNDLPKILCEFLNRLFNSKVVYTGSNGAVEFLQAKGVHRDDVSAVKYLLEEYEKTRFSQCSIDKFEDLKKEFSSLMTKLEGKA